MSVSSEPKTVCQSPYRPLASDFDCCPTLRDVFADESQDDALLKLSAEGILAQLIPEWARLTADDNIQHSTHHFPLDEHTLKVVSGTRATPLYQSLPRYAKLMTSVSALLHDIDKNTGPLRLKGNLPVDLLHPIKSAVMAEGILQRLGYSPAFRQRVTTLINHHQLFGRLFVFYDTEAPVEATDKIAVKIRSESLLKCLIAINEGDIRGVKAADALFSDEVAQTLPRYAQASITPVQRMTASKSLPHQSACSQEGQLTAFSGFYQVSPSETPPGGALWMRYAHSLADIEVDPHQSVVLCHVLPENLAYWGPIVWETLDAHPSMLLFYRLCLPEVSTEKCLSASEERSLVDLKAKQLMWQQSLTDIASRFGFKTWSDVYQRLDQASFSLCEEYPDLDAILAAVTQIYPTLFDDAPSYGLVTKPMTVALRLPGDSSWRLTDPAV